MAPIRRLVLDVLKPHEPPLPDLATRIAGLEGVAGTNLTLVEIDQKVTNVKLTIEGEDIDVQAVEDVVTGHGGTVHSIDEVVAGEHVVEASATPQD